MMINNRKSKSVFILFGLFLFMNVVCQTQKRDDSKNFPITITQVNKNYFDSIKNNVKNKIEIDSFLIKKQGVELKIPINGNKFISYIDDLRLEENQLTHYYLGYYKKVTRHLIKKIYFENVVYEFIGENGEKTEIWSEPIFSNNNKYFLTYKSYGLEGDFIGIQIWEIIENDLEINKILELNQLIFNPIECLWNEDNSILIMCSQIKSHYFEKNDSEIYYMKIQFNKKTTKR